MASIVLAHSSYADVATLSSGSYTAGLPRDNMKTGKLYEVARTTDATALSTKVIVDLGAPQPIGAVILGPTNLTADYTVRIRGSTTNAYAGAAYDSGTLASGITAADVDPEAGINVIHLLPTVQTLQWWLVELVDTANPAGYVQIGRLFMPQLVRPSINYAYGSNGLVFEDQSRRVEAMSGVEHVNRRRNRRVFNFAIPRIAEAEALGSVYRFIRTVGFDKTVFVIPDPADTAHIQARSFWGRIGTMDPISQAVFGAASVGFTIREKF